MTFDEAIKLKEQQDAKVSELSKVLQSYPKHPNGLTINNACPNYRKDKQTFAEAFKMLQKINQYIMRNHKNEYKEYRKSLNA
jgi:dihydroorotate dehydrogenase